MASLANMVRHYREWLTFFILNDAGTAPETASLQVAAQAADDEEEEQEDASHYSSHDPTDLIPTQIITATISS